MEFRPLNEVIGQRPAEIIPTRPASNSGKSGAPGRGATLLLQIRSCKNCIAFTFAGLVAVDLVSVGWSSKPPPAAYIQHTIPKVPEDHRL